MLHLGAAYINSSALTFSIAVITAGADATLTIKALIGVSKTLSAACCNTGFVFVDSTYTNTITVPAAMTVAVACSVASSLAPVGATATADVKLSCCYHDADLNAAVPLGSATTFVRASVPTGITGAGVPVSVHATGTLSGDAGAPVTYTVGMCIQTADASVEYTADALSGFVISG